MIWEVFYLATPVGIVLLGTVLAMRAQARTTVLGSAAIVLAWVSAGVAAVQSTLSLASLSEPPGARALATSAGVYVVAWFFVLTIRPVPLLMYRAPPGDERNDRQ